jgi:UDPglucose--hexose-1-phosphate uridylyltransferase
VGATIAHPHGQIYAFEHVPAAPAIELAHDACQVCAEEPGDRLVAKNAAWHAWVPDAATWPYALVLATRAHAPDLPSLRDESRDDLARILIDVLERLDALFGEQMPYMLWIHQRPTNGVEWPAAHLHLHIAPLYRAPGTQRFVAAGELGSGMFFNPVDPLDAADALRAAVVNTSRAPGTR